MKFCIAQLTQVADALIFLHSNDPKIIHGDVKGVRSFTDISPIIIGLIFCFSKMS